MPACAAGPGRACLLWQSCWTPAGSTQALTADTVVLVSNAPNPMNTTPKNSAASSRFIAGPATMIRTFCHHGLA
jgi:hypothetical protein